MKILVSSFLFILLCSCSKTKQKPSEITILGTVHFPTDYMNSDSIYNAIRIVNPDIIAMEADSSVFNSGFSFKKTYDENEYNAVLDYLKTNPEVMIRPIGLEGRNAYRKRIGIYSEAGFVYNAMYDLLDDEKLSQNHTNILLHFENLWTVMDIYKNETLTHINQKEVDRLIDSINTYQYIKTKDIVDKRKEFDYKIVGADKDSVSLRNYFNTWVYFESTTRNEALSKNLERLITLYPKKRIMVLTGFKHRSYILYTLRKKSDSLNLKIVEFYNY